MSRVVKVLLFSTLYPNSVKPGHGIFVETRLRELRALGGIEARVVAPVPWFPSTHERFGDYAQWARVPAREQRGGVDVLHPRYPVIPKVGMAVAPLALALGAWRALQQCRAEGFDFDLIDAHYAYPDGVAAALLSAWSKRPFIVTARGSDVNLIADFALPRRWLRWSWQRARACVGVSQALADRMADLGAPRQKVLVWRNGVDTDRFRPEPPAAARQRLRLPPAQGPWLLAVGNLAEVKRPHWVIEAFHALRRDLPDAQLMLVGQGPLRAALEAQAAALGLAQAVHFAGAVAQEELRWWYSAADLLLLASSREGWPNVLLEAMACGTPVVAAQVGGVPEVVNSPALGQVVALNRPDDLAQAVQQTWLKRLDRSAVRQHALSMGWSVTSAAQKDLFLELAALSQSGCTA